MHVLDRAVGGDYEPQARDALEVRTFTMEEIEGVARIDRRLTGRNRRGYLCRTLGEALAESALRPVALLLCRDLMWEEAS